MMWSWKIESCGDDTYRFTNSVGAPAGTVRIESGDTSIAVDDPVAEAGSFTQTLEPGLYEISWHWLVGDADVRSAAEFSIPFDGDDLIARMRTND